jgi:uncharacterized membrane protein
MIDTIKRDWMILLLILAPFAIALYFWEQLPDQFPIHFNAKGEVDRYGSKLFGLLILPCINIGFYFLLIAIPKIDPLKKNFELFKDKYVTIRLVIHLFQTMIFVVMVLFALGYKLDIPMVVNYSLLALMLVLGNYMGTIRKNYFIGIRTPWTLADDNVWTKTHRFTARLWVPSCLAMMIALPFLPKNAFVVVAFVLTISLIPVVYSYVLFVKRTDHA